MLQIQIAQSDIDAHDSARACLIVCITRDGRVGKVLDVQMTDSSCVVVTDSGSFETDCVRWAGYFNADKALCRPTCITLVKPKMKKAPIVFETMSVESGSACREDIRIVITQKMIANCTSSTACMMQALRQAGVREVREVNKRNVVMEDWSVWSHDARFWMETFDAEKMLCEPKVVTLHDDGRVMRRVNQHTAKLLRAKPPHIDVEKEREAVVEDRDSELMRRLAKSNEFLYGSKKRRKASGDDFIVHEGDGNFIK